jgi:peptidoglycan-associated lipoprotein
MIFRRWIVIPGRKGILITLVVVLLFSLTVFGCRTTKDLDVVVAEPTAEEPAAQPMVEEYKPEAAPAPAAPAPQRLGAPPIDPSMVVDVFFAYDRFNLTAESRDRLTANSKLLKAYKDVDIIIEGHCDERGTNEYNLGLGERRANAAKNYLVSLGVPAHRIKTISYGEERPFAMGHNEQAWKMNRRAHFVLP